ncbi:MAG: cyclase family protein [bacterium]|nr:cyclase family protein [bacterium]
MKKLYDATMPITSDMVIWPGERKPQRQLDSIIKFDGSETSTLTLNSHTGTHIDAPRHFLSDNENSITDIDLEKLIGPCHVFEIEDTESRLNNVITKQDIEKLNIQHPKVLFKTSNTKNNLLDKEDFEDTYISIDIEAAHHLIKQDVHLVGIDYLSVENQNNTSQEVHKAFLQNNIVIIEGVYLKHIIAGEYFIMALPIPYVGSDGSPARVILQDL